MDEQAQTVMANMQLEAAKAALADLHVMTDNADQGKVRAAILAMDTACPELSPSDIGMIAGLLIAMAGEKMSDDDTARLANAVMMHAAQTRNRVKAKEAKAPAPDAQVIRAPGNEWMDNPGQQDQARSPTDQLSVLEHQSPRMKLEGDGTVLRAESGAT